MAIPLIETLGDLLSATSGALAGAIVTGLFNRGRNKSLSDQVMAGQRELKKQEQENERLLDVIREKENTILQMQMDLLAGAKTKTRKRRK
ncbi:MAG: hypothetical protein K2M34_03575 [Alphaproteobacteria bacterium]|nr:hypothetical protein [Alphaproteobacteria bacterium]